VAVQPLAAQIVGNAFIYRRHPFRWPSAFQLAMAGKMLNYGWRVTLAQYVNGLQQSVMNVFVAIVGGAVGLGIFGRAIQVSAMISYSMMVSFDRLLHPLMRSIRDNQDRLRGIFIRGCIGSTLVCGFGWAWLAGTAPDLIRVVLGPQWGRVPLLLRIISTTLLTSGVGTMSVIVFHALGKPLIWLQFTVGNLVLLLVTAAVGLRIHRELPMIAVAFAIAQNIGLTAMWFWVIRRLRIAPAQLMGHMVRILAVSAASCGSMLLVEHWNAPSRLLRLILATGAGAAVFLGLALLIDREAILDFRTLLPRRVPDESPSPVLPPDAWQTDAGVGR
jgi:PST family polysaccharide transporter